MALESNRLFLQKKINIMPRPKIIYDVPEYGSSKFTYPTHWLPTVSTQSQLPPLTATAYLNGISAKVDLPSVVPSVEDLPPLERVDVPTGPLPPPKETLGDTLKSMAPAIGSLVGTLGGQAIGHGYSNDVANAATGVGQLAGQIVGNFNPILGGAISAASGILGGVGNRLFGSKRNEAGIANINAKIASTKANAGALAKATTTDELMDNWGHVGMMNNISQSDVGKDGLLSNKMARLRGKLNNESLSANAYAGHALAMGETNVSKNQADMADSKFIMALGGPLGGYIPTNMGAVDYGFLSDSLLARQQAAEAKDKVTGGINPFAEGGMLTYPSAATSNKSPKGRYSEDVYKAANILFDKQKGPYITDGKGKKKYISIEEADAMIDRLVAQQQQAAGQQAPQQATMFDYGGPIPLEALISRVPIFPNVGVLPKNASVEDVIAARQAEEEALDMMEERRMLDGDLLTMSTPRRRPVVSNTPDLYALGGDIQNHGADWTTGLTYVDAGGTHEENPNQGVQFGTDSQGTPNLLEEGETVFDDYVFSNRIMLDGGALERFHLPKNAKMTYAKVSKKLEKESKERPNDPLSQSSLKILLADLQEHQERQKQEMAAQEAQQQFASMSPQEQVAMMQQAGAEQQAQEQAMAEQAMQEQAMQQQAAQEMAMQQQGIPPEAMMGAGMQQPGMVESGVPMMGAYGGKINKFDEGGDLDKFKMAFMQALGAGKWQSDHDFDLWLKDNNLKIDEGFWQGLYDSFHPKEGAFTKWGNLNKSWQDAIKKSNPALWHSMEAGNDFSTYNPTPTVTGNPEISKYGLWAHTNPSDWDNDANDDPGWLEIKDKVKANPKMTRKEFAELLYNSEAFKNTTNWLKADKKNMAAYLNAIIKNYENSSDKGDKAAVAWARKWFDKDGNLKEDATYENIFTKREDYFPGHYHKSVKNLTGNPLAKNFIVYDDGTIADAFSVDGLTPYMSQKWGNTAYNYFKAKAADKKAAEEGPAEKTTLGKDYKPIHRNEALRYAGLLNPILGLATAGFTKPDTAAFDAAISSIRDGSALAHTRPIGDYLTYRPMAVQQQLYDADNSARATSRAIANAGTSVAGSRMAGQVANEYARQVGAGEIAKNSLLYNDQNRKMVGDFNRGTNQFNAQAFNQASLANAEMLNRNTQTNANMALQAAGQKLAADQQWKLGLVGNGAAFLTGLGNVGRENAIWNMIGDMAAHGIFGQLTPDTPLGGKVLEYYDQANKANKASQTDTKAYGGKIKTKKRRGGLTY